MAKRVLITGETGFIGSHLIKTSQELQCIPSKFNVLNPEEIRKTLLNVKPDAVLHLAGISLPADCDRNRELAKQVNVQGTQNIIDAIIDLSPKTKLVFASTAQVYQPLIGNGGIITESSPIEPLNFYALTKFKAEKRLKEAHDNKGLSVIIMRIFNHVHKSQKSGTFLGTLCQSIEKLKSNHDLNGVIAMGDLGLYRDMGSVFDLISAIESVLNLDEDFEVLNICNGRKRKLEDLAYLLCEKLGVKPSFIVEPTRIRKNDPQVLLGSHQKLSELTGWNPKVESNEELINDFLKDL